MPDRDWWSEMWADPETILRKIGIEPEMTVLDLCCGEGFFTAPLARLVGGKLYALDHDPGRIERTRGELERAGTSALDLICADARDLPLVLPASVDFILLANAIHGFPDQTTIARSMASVLNRGGHVAVVNWRPIPREQTMVLCKPRGPSTALRMSPEDVEDALYPADLYLDEVLDLPPYHYAALFSYNGPKPLSVKIIERMFEQGNINPDMYVWDHLDVPVEEQRAEAVAMLLEQQAEYWSRNTPDMWEGLDVLPGEDDNDEDDCVE